MPYRKDLIGPPWGGWDDSQPALTLPNNSFNPISNWLMNKGSLLPFPRLNAYTTPPGNNPILGARTFQDQANQFHTVVFTESQAFYLVNGVYTLITLPGGFVDLYPVFGPQPYATEVFIAQLFFTNGNTLKFVKGDAFSATAGNVPGGAFFLGELAGHLLMINTFEAQINYKNRVRYSAQNDGTQWDQSVDFTAGSLDIPGIEDSLTGWITAHNIGFAFHSFGLSTLTPTGVANSPFYVENFSQGPQGVGNYFAGALASYGDLSTFVAINDVYSFDGSGMTPIGGKAKNAILADLNAASSQVCSNMFGSLNNGIDYLSYWLAIPMNSDTTTSLWIYHYDEQAWFNVQLTQAVRTLASLFTE